MDFRAQHNQQAAWAGSWSQLESNTTPRMWYDGLSCSSHGGGGPDSPCRAEWSSICLLKWASTSRSHISLPCFSRLEVSGGGGEAPQGSTGGCSEFCVLGSGRTWGWEEHILGALAVALDSVCPVVTALGYSGKSHCQLWDVAQVGIVYPTAVEVGSHQKH